MELEFIKRITRKARNLLWNLWHSVRSLISWIPVAWRDRDWDHSFILDILDFKLRRVEKGLKKGCVDWEYDDDHKAAMNALEECIVLIGRMRQDRYWEETEDYQKEKELMKKDYDQFFELMARYICWWWD